MSHVSEFTATEQLSSIFVRYGIEIEEVACSTALFLLSVDNGQDIIQRVGKWFHPDTGERFFVHNGNSVKEYFTVILFENSVEIEVVSLGIVQHDNKCYDIFTFKEATKNDPTSTIESTSGYVLEIACVENDKSDNSLNLSDFGDAKHIENKYIQRKKNSQHYYPSRDITEPSEFLVITEDKYDAKSSKWIYEKAQIELCDKVHSWNISDVEPEQVTQAYNLYQQGVSRPTISESYSLTCVKPLEQTNIWGCLLYDIAAQSLSSASIPKTRLWIPWILVYNDQHVLTLKIIV